MVEINEYEKKCSITFGNSFSEGHAIVKINDDGRDILVVIDKDGNQTSNDDIYHAYTYDRFLNGYAVISRDRKDSDKEYGYIDFEGNIYMLDDSLSILNGNDSISYVEKKDNTWALYDMIKKEYIESKCKYPIYGLSDYSDDIIFIRIFKDNPIYVAVDKMGNLLSEELFSDVNSFVDGVALVKLYGSCNYIFVDKNFKNIFGNREFVKALPFREGVAVVSDSDEMGRTYYIDKIGNRVSKFYDRAYSMHNGRTVAIRDDVKFILDDKLSEMVSNLKCDFVGDFPYFSEYFIILKNNRYYYLDDNGRTCFNKGFYIAYSFSDGLAYVFDTYDNSYYYIDTEGKKAVDGVKRYCALVKFDDGNSVTLSAGSIKKLRLLEKKLIDDNISKIESSIEELRKVKKAIIEFDENRLFGSEDKKVKTYSCGPRFWGGH